MNDDPVSPHKSPGVVDGGFPVIIMRRFACITGIMRQEEEEAEGSGNKPTHVKGQKLIPS